MNKTLTVTEISQKIKNSIQGNPELTSIWVKGEISNITYHSSGHIYFTMKDKGSVLNAAFFKNANRNCKFKMREGMKIVAFGSITIYEKRGSYQMIVNDATPDGIGELQQQIEELKKKLEKEGVFNPKHKKRIPFLPKKIGVVTSPTGAAFRDILKVALRRYPEIQILLAPAKVQGDDAAETIATAIKELNKEKWGVDVIIAGRGGGSFEDLMPFNEEIVVRAFYESKIPIISAVGHQIDHPLSDDAADEYAPTPSAAAEIALPVKEELNQKLSYLIQNIFSNLQKTMEEGRLRIETIENQRFFKNPLEMIYMREIHLEENRNKLLYALKDINSKYKNRFSKISNITTSFENSFKFKRQKFLSVANSLHQLSPMNVIARGYSAAFDQNNNIIKSVDKINSEDIVDLYVSDGIINCKVTNTEKGIKIGEKKQ